MGKGSGPGGVCLSPPRVSIPRQSLPQAPARCGVRRSGGESERANGEVGLGQRRGFCSAPHPLFPAFQNHDPALSRTPPTLPTLDSSDSWALGAANGPGRRVPPSSLPWSGGWVGPRTPPTLHPLALKKRQESGGASGKRSRRAVRTETGRNTRKAESGTTRQRQRQSDRETRAFPETEQVTRRQPETQSPQHRASVCFGRMASPFTPQCPSVEWVGPRTWL